MKRLIIDCDPGLDDLMALALIGQENVDLLGITTVFGNNSVDITTQNAANIKDYFNLKAPLVKGADRPIFRERIDAVSIHGERGLGNINIPKVEVNNIKDKKAHRFLIEQSLKYPGQVEIVAIGPLTNIALAITNDSNFENNVARIIVMGGGHKFGNVTPSAEFNIYADPDAAKIVFDSAIPKVMVGLDITMSQGLKEEKIKEILGNHSSEKLDVIRTALYDTLNISKSFGFDESFLHDALAVLIAVDESFAKGRNLHVDIETRGKITTGKTVVDIEEITPGKKDVLFLESYDFDYYVSKLKALVDAYA